MALERLDRFEFLLLSNPSDEGDIDRLAVEVVIEVEEIHLEQRRAVVEHRPAAEAGNAVMTDAGDIDAHRIDAVLEPAGGIQLQIGGREAELTAALVAVNDLARDKPRGAE